MDTKDIKDIKKLIGSDIGRYTITRYIASGSFGHVFEARDNTTQKLIALKIPVQTEERDGQRSLLEEAKVYRMLSNPDKGVADMKILSHKGKKMIVMDLLGESLESLLTKHKKFSLKTVIALAVQMIDLMRYIHSCGFLHRDIKPDNFVLSNEERDKIFCIDFGLAKRYMKRSGEHIPYSQNKRFCGTARYASIAAHEQTEQGRKDDLESIGYILIYLFKGKLPWQGIRSKDKRERYRLIGEKKKECTEDQLCEGMPKEFCVFLKYIRSMDFDEKPHYSALRNMFIKLYESRGYKNDKLDWE